jgi:hypothetical protein
MVSPPLQRIDLAEQVLRRHALHHQRRRGAVDTSSGSGISTSAGITRTSEYAPCGPEQVADAVAGLEVGDAGPHRLDNADGVAAQAVGQRERIAARCGSRRR